MKFLLFTVALSFALLAQGQSAVLLNRVIAGGGGQSTGSVYSVSGTAGQHDVSGPLISQRYTLGGGFWALPAAMQNINAPMLKIVPAAPGMVTISWAPATVGFVLQETTYLSSDTWSNSPSGAANPATVTATLPSKYYRLFKP
jgi:hypothetical protein